MLKPQSIKVDNSRKRYKQQRNLDYQPLIDDEGVFVKPLPSPPTASYADRLWYFGLPPHDRLNFHQTLSSTRRYAGFRKFPNKVPTDSLDFLLQSQYQHDRELFADKVDIVLQPETVGRQTFRRIRNTRDLTSDQVIPIGHPLIIGKLNIVHVLNWLGYIYLYCSIVWCFRWYSGSYFTTQC